MGMGKAPSDTGSSRVVMYMPVEPTYRMEPRQKFNPKEVELVIMDVLGQRLTGFKYSQKQSPAVAKVLSEEIKERIKKLKYDRYKIVCVVTIGDRKSVV